MEVFEFNKELTVQDNVKALIITKQNLKKALTSIGKFEQIYADEIKEQSKNLHMTRDGAVMFIKDMTDTHLLFTVRLLVKAGHGYNSSKTKRYMTEVKFRNLVSKCIDMVGEDMDKGDEESDDDILGEDDFIGDDK